MSELTPEEEAFVASVIGLWGGKKKPKALTCECVGKSGERKKSFANPTQAKQWAGLSGRRGARVYRCEEGRWHVTSGLRGKLKKLEEK